MQRALNNILALDLPWSFSRDHWSRLSERCAVVLDASAAPVLPSSCYRHDFQLVRVPWYCHVASAFLWIFSFSFKFICLKRSCILHKWNARLPWIEILKIKHVLIKYIKTPQWDITSHLLEWLLLERQEVTSVGEDSIDREKGPLAHCWWECKLVQPSFQKVWSVFLPFDSELKIL